MKAPARYYGQPKIKPLKSDDKTIHLARSLDLPELLQTLIVIFIWHTISGLLHETLGWTQ
jgi:hypothetical protein